MSTDFRQYIYFDEKGAIFSVSDFIRVFGLPDDLRLRLVIIEEIKDIFPGIRIKEELN